MGGRLIDRVARRQEWVPGPDADALPLVSREWLVTNGIGGYASSTLAGVATRRYHGLLVAALPNPLGRTVMLNHLAERVEAEGRQAALGGEEWADGRLEVGAAHTLVEFRLESGLPVWHYRVGDARIEKRIVMPYRQNTVILLYRLVEGRPVTLRLRPAVHFRNHEAPVGGSAGEGYTVVEEGDHHLVRRGDDHPPLRFHARGANARFVAGATRTNDLLYRLEEARGYEFRGALWTPGEFVFRLTDESPAALVASSEMPDVMGALTPQEALAAERERRRRLLGVAPAPLRTPLGAELVLAADQFLISPVGRVRDRARAQALGDEVRTVIAGYHWFTDWGRDTMISLEGLTLATGRHREASFILRTFSHYVQDGLIPNMFPDGSNAGLYHTADATLWFFHAVDRYVSVTGDRETLRYLIPVLSEIVRRHVAGTRFGIGMDPADGLLRQGEEGYQLTWMDAKCDGWVVTPRRGKAVEINALWYNALRCLARWISEERPDDDAARLDALADRVRESFNRRFWSDEHGHLFDVVDGPEGDLADCRPNQLFAISLPNPVLAEERWTPVVEVVRERLLTPVGLRSLAPGSAGYHANYHGDLRARDAAYHQGTVWGWLIGPWIDAWLRVHPEDLAGARRMLDGLIAHLDDFGVGSAAEIFDAEPPFTPRGCIAQAWSIAELVRCLLRTERAVEAG